MPVRRRRTPATPAARSNEPLVLWRHNEDGERVGLACDVHFCSNPGCSCDAALLEVSELDEDGEASGAKAAVTVDLGSGAVGPAAGEEPTPRQGELLRWLEEALDADGLEALCERRDRFVQDQEAGAERAARRTWEECDWTWWDGEDPVSWDEVAAGLSTEPDVYTLEGKSFEAADYYCMASDCTCADVRVHFYALPEPETGSDLAGRVWVDAQSGEVVQTDNQPGFHETLLRLWQEYVQRNEVSELVRRWRRTQQLGPRIQALREKQLGLKPVRERESVGRNDPCPCGSGKKYKKCCLGREA